jgi:hypothetical protein
MDFLLWDTANRVKTAGRFGMQDVLALYTKKNRSKRGARQHAGSPYSLAVRASGRFPGYSAPRSHGYTNPLDDVFDRYYLAYKTTGIKPERRRKQSAGILSGIGILRTAQAASHARGSPADSPRITFTPRQQTNEITAPASPGGRDI